MTDSWCAPASFLQERWFRSAEDRWCNHNNVVAWQVDGTLDTGALLAAIDALAARHETLRTALVARGSGVVQAVRAAEKIPVRLADLSESAAQEKDLDTLIVADAEQPFLLTEAPLWRVGLVRLGRRRHVLVLVVSHAVSDGWSMGVALRDLTRLYQGIVTGRDARLPALDIQFGDYAAWERELSEPALASWWRDRLSPLPARPALPGRRGWRDQVAFRMDGRLIPRVDAVEREHLTRVAAEHGGSLAGAVTAGVAAALSRYVDGELVIGFMQANRDRAQVQPLVGPVFDYLPLRLDTAGDPAFAGLVRQVCVALREARQRRLPLGAIEDAVPSTKPLFDVVVEFLPYSNPAPLEIPGPRGDVVAFVPFPLPELTVRHSGDTGFAATATLNYIVRQTGDGGLDGVVYGNALTVPPETLGTLGAEFAATLTRAVAGDERAIIRP